MKEWADIIIHGIIILLLWQIYDVVKNIRKVLSGEIADDTFADFAKEILKGKKEMEGAKKKRKE